MTARRVAGGIALCALLASCAWSDRANRPVWNAFEEHLVPRQTGWFALSLPLTVPLGLTAIVCDTLVAHPLQVADDAWDAAAGLWRERDWERRYFTELGVLPLRAGATPVVFTSSFLWRSMFLVHDGEPRPAVDPVDAGASLRDWLGSVADEAGAAYGGPLPATLDEPLRAALRTALERGDARGRLAVYRTVLRRGFPPSDVDPDRGLRDADPVVRFLVLDEWPDARAVDLDTVRALWSDPVESIRLRAKARWPE